MTTLKQLLEARAQTWDQMQALRFKAKNEGRDQFNASEARDWAKAEGNLDNLTKQIEAAQAHDNNVRNLSGEVSWSDGSRSMVGNTEPGQPLAPEQRMAQWAESRGLIREEERELNFGKYIRGMATGDWQGADAERRAMAEGTNSAGGFMVPTLLSSELIDLARNKARVIEAGARIIPMEAAVVNVARWAGDPTPQWRSEAASIPNSDASLAQLQLKAKSLAVVTQVSRELVEDATSGGSVGEAIKHAFAEQFALTLDNAALYGSGTDPQPRGIKNTSGVNTQSMGTNGAAPTNWDFLVDAVGSLRDNNEEPSAIIYSPRTDRELGKLKDTQGRYLAPPAILDGVPRLSTNQVPNNLTVGTGTTTSDAFAGDFHQLLVGIRTQLMISVLTERYSDTGQIGFLGWLRADIAVARPKAFTVVTGIA